MVKIRTPAGAERQGHLCCSQAGPGRADRRHGEGAAVIQAQSLRNASRDSPAIPEAAAHLSGMRCSELLTTSSNWTIFSYLSGSQLHRLQRASVRTEKAQDKESLLLVFLASFPQCLSFSFRSHPSIRLPGVGVFLSQISLGCSAQVSEVTRVCGVIYRDIFEVFMELGASYQEL